MHAEPDETATAFSDMSSASPSTTSKLTLRLPGRRRVGWPLVDVATRRNSVGPQALPQGGEPYASSCDHAPGHTHAFPSPTMPGTFSVPLRRPFSWPPPSIWGVPGEPAACPIRT